MTVAQRPAQKQLQRRAYECSRAFKGSMHVTSAGHPMLNTEVLTQLAGYTPDYP